MHTLLIILGLTAASSFSQEPLVAIGGIVHETNTFNPRKTTIRDFETGLGSSGILRGDKIIEEAALASSTTSGFIEGAKRYGLKLYPTLQAGPQTIGIVTKDTFETLTIELVEKLKAAPKLSGILLNLHGTMVSEGHPHADAEIVRRVRNAFGPSMPIVVTHDFHANVSPEIVELSNALITYKECPHVDAKERGIQAAQILAQMIQGKVHPVQVLVKPPMMYNLVHQNTFAPPYKPIVDESRRLEQNPKILAVSVPGGYQWADIPAMGPSVIVVTDNDRPLAEREAKRLADMLYATRDKLALKLPDPANAVRQSMSESKGPVVLLDTGDNIGGGSSGDSTFILAELLRQKATGWVVALADEAATDAAFKAGIGGAYDLPTGGKMDRLHGDAVRVKGRVRSLHDGKFIEPEVRHGGLRYWDMGLTAVIEMEGSTRDLQSYVVLTKKRIIPFSIHQLTSVGIDPKRQRILVVKGTVAPRAAYEPIAAKLVEVDSGGVTAVNPRRFTYHNIKPGLFGME